MRGKGITEEEDQIIKIGLQRGKSVKAIADFLGRSRAAIYKRIERMQTSGEINQIEMDMGQLDE